MSNKTASHKRHLAEMKKLKLAAESGQVAGTITKDEITVMTPSTENQQAMALADTLELVRSEVHGHEMAMRFGQRPGMRR